MIYKYDFINNKLYENNIELNSDCVLLGRFDGGDNERDSILKENNNEKIYDLFINYSGNYAKIGVDKGGLVSIITSGFISVYYYIDNHNIYISDMMKDVENMSADSSQIDYDSVYYYIASGNYPPLNNTFWSNIHKVSGEHHVIIDRYGSVQDKKWTFFSPDKEIRDKKKEYEEILHFEAEGLKNWLNKTNKQPYCLISGVDSFNSFLAMKYVGVNPVAIHANVHNLQRCYVGEFIKEYSDTEFIEVEGINYSQITAQTIIDSYKEAINPFRKHSTDNPITAVISERCNKQMCIGEGRFNNNIFKSASNNKKAIQSVEITGDLTGLSMAIKAFNSTLNQHSFFGRHFLGSIKRKYYNDGNLVKANKRFGKDHSLYDFMTSMFLPTDNFDALIPFKSLKKASGLNDDEKEAFIAVVHKFINQYASSVNWDLSHIYDGNVGKLFRSYKRELYMPGLPLFCESRKNLYGVDRILLFSSSRASVFEDNYSLDFYNDIWRSKKCVYDYFDSHHLVDMVTMGKKAFRKSLEKMSLKSEIAAFILYPARFIPNFIKNSEFYYGLKKRIKSIRKEAGKSDVYAAGSLTVSDEDTLSECIRFSDNCLDKVMHEYFNKIENSIYGKDMLEYSPVEERYVALSVYMKARIQHNKGK